MKKKIVILGMMGRCPFAFPMTFVEVWTNVQAPLASVVSRVSDPLSWTTTLGMPLLLVSSSLPEATTVWAEANLARKAKVRSAMPIEFFMRFPLRC